MLAASRLLNPLLQDGRYIIAAMRLDPAWKTACLMPKSTKEQRHARSVAFQNVRRTHGFTEYDFHARATRHKNDAGFNDRIGAHIAQKLGTRAFSALEDWLVGTRGMPRFKGVQRPLHSIEGKDNNAALRWDATEYMLVMNKSWAIPVKNLRLHTDEWLWSALKGNVKYCRLLRRHGSNKVRYYVQLIMDGHAPMKASVLGRLAEQGTLGGLDIGPSNIAWCTENDADVIRFCADVDSPNKLIKRLRRQIDRQRRANNPNNFDEKGRAKRGRTWVKSGRQRQAESHLRSTQTHTAERRANAHGRDINQFLAKARKWRHDGVSVQSLQRNYGRSVAARAPGRFMSELKSKAERAGGGSFEVNVRQLKTSQFDHSTGAFIKKTLSERWHVFGDGRGRVQRDVYSAFLALHAVEKVDADGVIAWSHDCTRLEAAWVILEPALRAKKLFKEMDDENTSARASIARRAGSCESTSSKVKALSPLPDRPARGAARVEMFPHLSA